MTPRIVSLSDTRTAQPAVDIEDAEQIGPLQARSGSVEGDVRLVWIQQETTSLGPALQCNGAL